jgi:hypothetical protein
MWLSGPGSRVAPAAHAHPPTPTHTHTHTHTYTHTSHRGTKVCPGPLESPCAPRAAGFAFYPCAEDCSPFPLPSLAFSPAASVYFHHGLLGHGVQRGGYTSLPPRCLSASVCLELVGEHLCTVCELTAERLCALLSPAGCPVQLFFVSPRLKDLSSPHIRTKIGIRRAYWC